MYIALALPQLFVAFVASRMGCWWRLCVDEGRRLPVVPILLSLIAVAPLAHSSPVDPLCIRGIYDVGYRDDAIWALTDPDTTTSCAATGVKGSAIVPRGLLSAAVW